MNGGFAVVDADRHVREPDDLWDRYLEPAFRERVAIAPECSQGFMDGQPVLTPAARAVPTSRADIVRGAFEDALYRRVFADAVAHDYDAASNLRDMDREGVDVA